MRKEAKVLTFFISRVQRVVFQRLFKVPQGIQGKGNSAMHTKVSSPRGLAEITELFITDLSQSSLGAQRMWLSPC